MHVLVGIFVAIAMLIALAGAVMVIAAGIRGFRGQRRERPPEA